MTNPAATSQEFIQGIVWLVSMVGSYFAAWQFFVAGGKSGEWGEKFWLYMAAVCFAAAGSLTWSLMGDDIIGRLVHPGFFVRP